MAYSRTGMPFSWTWQRLKIAAG